ncbi:MAG: alpha-mannosidase [Candidatus Nanopelagicales bacterium]
MHENQALSIGRVTRVLGERIRPAIHSSPHALEVASHRVGGEPIPVREGLAAEYQPTAVGAGWGRAWDTTWFRLRGVVPEEFAGRRVEVLVDLGFDANLTGFQAEALVYRGDGSPVRSLHPRAQWIPVTDCARGGEPIEFFVEAAANPVILDYHPFLPTEDGEWETAGEELRYRLRRVDMCLFESEVFELAHDIEVLLELAGELPAESGRRARILRALDQALDRLDLQRVAATATASRQALAEVLSSPAAASAHRIAAVGHAHIDSAWLWPLRETVRKVARTTSSMTALLDENPDFIYAMSSAQQYAWLKEHRPEVFARVKKAVAEGRFVPVGGMWVESDAVLPSGESLIRQIAAGQRFFRDEFGIECRGAWLPDSFGYSAALPQILTGAGFEWFLTQKISWNQQNRFPHHTFLWEGIDGSRIFTHFPPMDTYNSALSGKEVALAARQFREKAVASSSLAPTGWGDGGGGTTREMIARARRLSDLEGSPRVSFETPDSFFTRAKEELPEPAVWRGELYLELHRATYTTQHQMKAGNRRSEELLAAAELWSATAAIRTGHPYPYQLLDRLWREVLLLQFHDILPGTAISWVHREAAERYARIAGELESTISAALAALGVGIGSLDGPIVAVNSAPVPAAGIPAGSVGVAAPDPSRRAVADGDGFLLVSDHVWVRIDACGHVVSAVDLASGRDAIPAGLRGNLLQLHQDFPNMWDAWDVDVHYRGMGQDLVTASRVTLADEQTVLVERAFGASRIEQRIRLGLDGRTIEIDNVVDWHETEKFLKLAFPVDVFADSAIAETQFGYQARPTHENTSWDSARFETHTQRWFLLQEPGFGVALLNDSSYGFDVTRIEHQGRIVQLARWSVLRAPRFPDPQTDQGTQRMRFGVLVGSDPLAATAAACRFNVGVRSGSGAVVPPLVSSCNPEVLISAVKLADDRSGDLVVRVYSAGGGRARARLVVPAKAIAITRSDLLERTSGKPDDLVPSLPGPVGVECDLALRPFEVATLRITF